MLILQPLDKLQPSFISQNFNFLGLWLSITVSKSFLGQLSLNLQASKHAGSVSKFHAISMY